MKILFVATRKNSSPTDRELYEMDFLNGLLGFKQHAITAPRLVGVVLVAAGVTLVRVF